MKIGLFALLLLALIPGCGCGKKETKQPQNAKAAQKQPSMPRKKELADMDMNNMGMDMQDEQMMPEVEEMEMMDIEEMPEMQE